MAKPEDLWQHLLFERFEAFRASGQLERLRTQGLQALGKKRLLGSLDYWKLPLVEGPEAYQSWKKECKVVALRYGLTPWTVEMACLLKDYDPQSTQFPIGLHWPQMKIVTSYDDPVFLKHLFYHARRMGVPVYLRQAGRETVLIFIDYKFKPSKLPDSHKPPFHDVFKIEIEFPPIFPSQAQKMIAQNVQEVSRKLLLRLGYPSPKRLRATSLLPYASQLRLNKPRLAHRELYEIVEETTDWATTEEDEKHTKQLKSRRHRLIKRIIKPYEKDK